MGGRGTNFNSRQGNRLSSDTNPQSDYILSRNSDGQELRISRASYERRLAAAEKQYNDMMEMNANPRFRSSFGPKDFSDTRNQIEELRRILARGRTY